MHNMDFSTNQGTAKSVLKKVEEDRKKMREEINNNFNKLYGMTACLAKVVGIMAAIKPASSTVRNSIIDKFERSALPENWNPESQEAKGWIHAQSIILPILKEGRDLQE